MHTILAILSLHDQEISFHFSLIFFDNNLKFSRYTVCAFVNLSEGVLVYFYILATNNPQIKVIVAIPFMVVLKRIATNQNTLR